MLSAIAPGLRASISPIALRASAIMLIEKTSSIEELLKFTALQEDTINKNVYTISHNLYTKNNYNDEFKTQLKVNQEILNTLKSIEEKLDKPNKQKKKNTK